MPGRDTRAPRGPVEGPRRAARAPAPAGDQAQHDESAPARAAVGVCERERRRIAALTDQEHAAEHDRLAERAALMKTGAWR